MSTYRYEYRLNLSLNAPCREHMFLLKCFPQDNRRQRILKRETVITPECQLAYSKDWAGNVQGVGSLAGEHSSFSVEITGEAETYADFYEEYDPSPSLFYRYPTHLTAAGDRIKALVADMPVFSGEYEQAVYLLHLAHGALQYETGTTTVKTVAEEAIALGKGVCQDFTNIYLALCRLCGIPCRYCAGLVAGIGESHAWAEVNCKGYWYAFDPTADLIVGEGYLKFAHGRDCPDCALSRGSFRGAVSQTQTVTAVLTKSDGQ